MPRDGHVLIDVREDREWAAGHAAGAIHLSKGIIERDIETEIPDKSTTMVLYCGGGFRSALVGGRAAEDGLYQRHFARRRMARVEPGGVAGGKTLAALQVLQPCVQDLFHPAQLRSPELAHIVEAPIDGVESPIDGVELRVDVSDQQASQRGVEQQRNPHRKIKLFVSHHERGSAPLELFSHNADSATLFEMIQTRVQHALHPMQFGSPQVAHVVKARIHSLKLRVHIGNQDADQRGVEQQRNPHRKIKLFVGHHERSSAPLELFSHNA